MSDLERNLATYGSDFSRWPDGADEARAALLAQPEFRRAWESERSLDRALGRCRDALDAEIAGAGALARLSRLSGRRASAGFLAELPWRRVAAGVLLAGMLGGALDLMLPGQQPDPLDLALVDPLVGLDAR